MRGSLKKGDIHQIKEQENAKNKMGRRSGGDRVRKQRTEKSGENIPFIKSIDKGFEEKDGGNKEGKEREKYSFNRMNR